MRAIRRTSWPQSMHSQFGWRVSPFDPFRILRRWQRQWMLSNWKPTLERGSFLFDGLFAWNGKLCGSWEQR